MHPIGQPGAVDGVAVGAIAEDRNLFVVAFNPSNGAELWRKPASPGEVVPGIQVGPRRVGNKVAYFRPAAQGGLYASLVVADAHTGADVAVSAPLLFGSPPVACADHVDVCTLSRTGPGDGYSAHRLRVATGEYLAEDSGLPPGARLIGQDGLVEFGTRNPETFGLVRDGKLRWRTPLSQAFPAGFSTDNGWVWYRFPAQRVYAGSVFGRSDGPLRGVRTRDLAATAASAGLSEGTGTVLWRDPGSAVGCSGTLAVAANPDDPDSPVVPVRCRATGTITVQPGGSPSFTGLDVTIEGFDVTTGTTTWSIPVGAAETLAGANTNPAVAGTTQVLIQTGTGPLVVDLASGAHHSPATGAVFWCRSDHQFDYHEPYPGGPNLPPRYSRRGGELAAACDATGKPVTGLPPGPATAAIGAHAGRVAVVATADGFSGYTIS
jgi:hypothetical protein